MQANKKSTPAPLSRAQCARFDSLMARAHECEKRATIYEAAQLVSVSFPVMAKNMRAARVMRALAVRFRKHASDILKA